MYEIEKELKKLIQHLNTAQKYKAANKPDSEDLGDRGRSANISSRAYRELIEAIPDPVVVYAPEGAALYINQAFSLTYGFSPQEVLGQRIDFVPPEETQRTLEVWRRTLAGEKVTFDTKRRTKDGRTLDIQLRTSIITDENAKHIASIVIHRDVTPVRRTESERLERERLQAAIETAGAVCHELGQPLQVITSVVELLDDPDLNEKGLKDSLSLLRKQVKRLGRITRQLSDLTLFKTKTYLKDTKILDLGRSANSDNPKK